MVEEVRPMNEKKTGELITRCRHRCGLTQLQLAEKLGVSNRAVSKWERGAGFPDISLLEPLADALGISVVELLHGEQAQADTGSDIQVRQAVRVIACWAARSEKMCRVWRRVKMGLLAALGIFLIGTGAAFVSTGGDGYSRAQHRQVLKNGYQSTCRNLSDLGVFKVEIFTEDGSFTLTDRDSIAAVLEVLGKIEVGKEYRDWGPESLSREMVLHADGWTVKGEFKDTEDYALAFTFPVFSADFLGADPAFYYQAVIDDQEAWETIEQTLAQLPQTAYP